MRARTCGVVVALAALAGGCTSRDPTYCDAVTPCADPGTPYCNLDLLVCQTAPRDGGPDGAVADGGGVDGGGDAGGDAGLTCPPTQRVCGAGCYDRDDPTHCGASCTACSAPAHGTATCDGTACDFTCSASYWKNGTACDACDTTAHCGPTCVECTAPANGQPTCDGTACDFACDAAYWRDGDACTACDTAAHCGAACGACSGTTPECRGGQTGQCGCTATSCVGVAPVCATSTGLCRACQQHAECPSGMCGDDGACVAEVDIIYLQPTSCDDGGPGTAATPLCTFQTAFAAAQAGPRFHILARAGYYHVTATQTVQNQRVVVAGVATNLVTVAQDGVGLPVFAVLRGGSLWLSKLSVVGATGGAGHGLVCTPTGTTGGMPNVTLDEATVSNNGGNGVDATTCQVTLRRSSASGNDGVGVRGSAAQITVVQSGVLRNHAGGLDLASGSYDIENSLLARNGTTGVSGSELGGARLDGVAGSRRFVNNTVVDNVARTGAASAGVSCLGASPCEVVNSILYLNDPGQQVGCSVSYSTVQDGTTTNGNLTGNPFFVDRPNSNYHLTLGPTPSPCIDGGTPTGAPLVDFDGYPRSGNPDMGCYEAH